VSGDATLHWRRAAATLLPALAYAALIFWLSHQPNPFPSLTARLSDKLAHLIEYAVLAVLVTAGLARAGLGAVTAGLWAVVVGSAYGLTDEIHQAFVPHRSADVRDWVADTLGALLGAALAVAFLRRRKAGASIRA
jgi:VanZ family protein